MNRLEIKEKAKGILKENFKGFWKGYLIILAISFLCAFVIELLFDRGSIIYNCFTIIASFFTMTLSVGLYSYLLKMVRGEEYTREDLFSYVGKIFPIVTISILVTIFCFLWSILLIIPGIIAAISYTMVFLIFVDSSELSPMEYLEQSKEMMHGFKWDYFVFCLSFLGWILLSIITCGIGFIWTIPYITISEVIYYDELKKLKKENNVDK